MVSNIELITRVMETLLARIGLWVGQNADKFTELGFKIGLAIVVGITKAFFNIGVGIGDKISANFKKNTSTYPGDKRRKCCYYFLSPSSPDCISKR